MRNTEACASVLPSPQSSSLAVSYFRDMIATACRATSAEHAVVRVYNSSTWQPVGKPLEGHSLTVTRIAFSPDDRFILSVSRDRTWRLYQAQEDAGKEIVFTVRMDLNQSISGYTAVAANKAHGRIIWDCAWAHEGHIFATASRDKTARKDLLF
jgi:WD40 repeat protein